MSMDGFEKAAETSEVPPGTSKIVKALGAEIFVVNIDGTFHAFPNKCTHAGGPLGRGKLTGSVMQCPWHGWKFSVKTGQSPETEVVGVRTFEVKVEGEDVYVGI